MTGSASSIRVEGAPASRLGFAWLFMCMALAIRVTDFRDARWKPGANIRSQSGFLAKLSNFRVLQMKPSRVLISLC